MLLDRLFKPRAAQSAGRALYAQAVEQSRTPGLYAHLGAPDTAEGRFEIYSLHVVLVLDRLRGRDGTSQGDGASQGDAAKDVSQALFDAYLKDLDHALRELGVGDLSVGRRMRKLGEAFYGRGTSYERAFAALPDEAPLQALIARTVYAETDAAQAPRLTAYVLGQRAALAAQPLEVLTAGEVVWKPL